MTRTNRRRLTVERSTNFSALYVPAAIALSLRSVLARHQYHRYSLPAYTPDLFNPLHRLSTICHKMILCQSRLTFCTTFSRESGESTENAMRMTWALEYDSGLNRSYSSCPLRAVYQRAVRDPAEQEMLTHAVSQRANCIGLPSSSISVT